MLLLALLQGSKTGCAAGYEALPLSYDKQRRQVMLQRILPASLGTLDQQDGRQTICPGRRWMQHRYGCQVLRHRSAIQRIKGVRVTLPIMFEIIAVVAGCRDAIATQRQDQLSDATGIARLLNGDAPGAPARLAAVRFQLSSELYH